MPILRSEVLVRQMYTDDQLDTLAFAPAEGLIPLTDMRLRAENMAFVVFLVDDAAAASRLGRTMRTLSHDNVFGFFTFDPADEVKGVAVPDGGIATWFSARSVYTEEDCREPGLHIHDFRTTKPAA
jgi:hypothetical protein